LGKPYNPRKLGTAPWSRMNSSANLSKYKVVTPSLISEAIIPNVLDTIKALSRINSICSLVFGIIMVFFSDRKNTILKLFNPDWP
jgi:hypothetical protein